MAKDPSGDQQRAGRNWTEIASDLDLRSFLRLTGWGSAAVAALFLAGASALSGSGVQRLFAATAQGDAAPPLSPAELTARAAAANDAIRQLTQAVRRLSAEREETAARVAALERSLDDVTGSIKSAASAPPSPAPPAPNATAGAAAPLSAAAPSAASSSSAPPPATRPAAAMPNAAAPSVAASGAAAPSAATPTAEVAEPAAARTAAGDLGVDVGGAVNFDGLRVLWTSTREHNPALFEGLVPVVAVRESSKTHNAELRLVIGPLAGAETAGRICAALSAARRYCQPVAFEGQRLLVAEAVPERSAAPQRKRAAAAERKPRTGQ